MAADTEYERGWQAGYAVAMDHQSKIKTAFSPDHKVDRFLSNDARYVRCVRESDFDDLVAAYERLKRGEFICTKCGLRKNAESPDASF